ncbi:peptidylprolyl isomerase [Candidimonas nitroreducens]|uniref:Chaperone SurA n=1 Tax=Candidimonas nitroreducens TaxID=683354 RepID=A0A225MNJ3_9BURK|nr:peptidylprolyl isomerase [Candidimonas nitroreducens]OWT60339.1 molecular chaperone SurA [Candidimonas nitroreducens]
MHSPDTKRWLAALWVPVLGALACGPAQAARKPAAHHAPAPAKSAQQAPQSEQFVDGIAAVVNKHVITLGQVDVQVKIVAAQLKAEKIAVPDYKTLQHQVLQRMITDELLRQEARTLGIAATDADLQAAVETVAKRNHISVERLQQEVPKTGVPWDQYLLTLRQEILTDKLRQREVDTKIVVSDADVDSYLQNQGNQPAQPSQPAAPAAAPAQPRPAPPPPAQSGPRVLGLAEILVAVPEGASTERVAELRRKAESVLAKLRSGADFASVAAASSDDAQAMHGGVLGVRPVGGWPDLFINATKGLQVGQISGIIQSGNGFHILKVLTRGPTGQRPAPAAAPAAPEPAAGLGPTQPQAMPQGPMMVTQTHARHILIKVTKVMSDSQAQALLERLRQRIESGEKFADLARLYSQDATAPQGGDLGWLSPGETVPAFEQAMNALQPGQVSQPVRSPFGWHLIEVEGRRTKDMSQEYKRIRARQILFQRREEPAYEAWLSQLRGKAYIDNRLDPESSRRPG